MKWLWRVDGYLVCATTVKDVLAAMHRQWVDDPTAVPVGGCYGLRQYLAEKHSVPEDELPPPEAWVSVVPPDEWIELSFWEVPDESLTTTGGVYDVLPDGASMMIGMEARQWAERLPVGWSRSAA